MLLLILETLSRDVTLRSLLFEAGLINRFANTRLELSLVKRPRLDSAMRFLELIRTISREEQRAKRFE